MNGKNLKKPGERRCGLAHSVADLRNVQISGAEGARTLNLRIANAALSQLSYRPIQLDLFKSTVLMR
jgi:hypothetical protein